MGKAAPADDCADPHDAAVSGIYAAALDQKLWPHAVERVARLCGATAGHLFSPRPEMDRLLRCLHNFDPEGGTAYKQHWIEHDEWVAHSMPLNGCRTGVSIIGDELIAPNDLIRTGFGHDFAHRYELDQIIATAVYDDSVPAIAPATYFSVFRGPERPRFQRHEQAHILRLLPHFQRAIEIHWRLYREGQHKALTGKALDALDDALFLLTRDGRLMQTNARAQALCTDPVNLAVRNNRIERLGRRSRPAVHEAIACCARTGAVMHLLVELAGKLLPLARASVHPISPGTALGLPDEPALLLIVQLPRGPSPALLQQVGQLYGFTPAEQKVALLLLEGKHSAEVATKLDLRLSTVKTHIAHLLDKSEQRRVVDLVRALSALG